MGLDYQLSFSRLVHFSFLSVSAPQRQRWQWYSCCLLAKPMLVELASGCIAYVVSAV